MEWNQNLVYISALLIFGLFVSEEKWFQGYIWLVFSSSRISCCIFIGFEPSAKIVLSRQFCLVSLHHFIPLQMLERKVRGRSEDFWPLMAYYATQTLYLQIDNPFSTSVCYPAFAQIKLKQKHWILTCFFSFNLILNMFKEFKYIFTIRLSWPCSAVNGDNILSNDKPGAIIQAESNGWLSILVDGLKCNWFMNEKALKLHQLIAQKIGM